MKKIFPSLFLVFFLATSSVAFAQPMMGRFSIPSNSDSETAKEEQEGFQIWQKLQSGEVICQNLSDDDYELLGDYFMGQWTGSSHGAMDQMMLQMMGEYGERQMHIALGKRQSGCDLNVQLPAGGIGFMPMVGMMQNFGGGWFSFITSLIFTILLWFLIIGGIIMLVRSLVISGKGGMMRERDDLTIQILKERYAKGEISRDEFEKMKKDLS